MRIALLNPRPQRRGGEISSRRLAESLRSRGHQILEVYLYPRTGDEPLAKGLDEVVFDCDERHWTERLLGWHPDLGRRLRRTLAAFAPDVLQVSGGRTLKYAALLLDDLAPAPLLVYRNIGEPGRWLRGLGRRWLYERRLFPRVGAVATIAQKFVPELERLCPNAALVRAIPTELDLGELPHNGDGKITRARLETPQESQVVLYAGKLSSEKRVDRLVRALPSLVARNESVVLWIAGEGPLERRLRRLATNLEISDHVRFLGVRSDVPFLIHAADVVALASDTEGVPTVLREASALGRAVVATDVGATSEIVAHGETGMLVEPGDDEALGRCLGDLLADPGRRYAMGQAARRRFAADSANATSIASLFERLYLEALPRRAIA